MDWVSGWIQGIIVAVVISTIIEMILPEGTSKKYIKVVIGVYILFSIISPVVTKITGNSFNLSNVLDLDEYVQASSSNNYEDLSESQEKQIKNIYQNSLKNDIREKIEEKGYKVLSVNISVANDENYTIEEINVKIKKETQSESLNNENSNSMVSANSSVKTVNEIKVEIVNGSENNLNKENSAKNNSNEQNSAKNNSSEENSTKTSSINEGSKLTNQQIQELKNYLSNIYGVEKININS